MDPIEFCSQQIICYISLLESLSNRRINSKACRAGSRKTMRRVILRDVCCIFKRLQFHNICIYIYISYIYIYIYTYMGICMCKTFWDLETQNVLDQWHQFLPWQQQVVFQNKVWLNNDNLCCSGLHPYRDTRHIVPNWCNRQSLCTKPLYYLRRSAISYIYIYVL